MPIVILVALMLGCQTGLAVWQPGPFTIGGAVFVAVLLVVNVMMWRDRQAKR